MDVVARCASTLQSKMSRICSQVQRRTGWVRRVSVQADKTNGLWIDAQQRTR